MPDSTIPTHRYEIEPRASHLGGGWRLRCFEGDEEVAGGVFPLDPELGHDDADKEAYGDAMEEGEAWLAERADPTPNDATQDLIRVGPEGC